MTKRRVVITGGTGLLALNWACAVRQDWDVVLGTHLHAVTLSGTKSCALNLRNLECLEMQFRELLPDVVVHAAGLTNVDRCEEFPLVAHEANAEAARNVALAASQNAGTLIHISSDHLFSGEHSLYREEDVPQPLNEYGRSKLTAEQWVRQACPHALILRTNFFGWGHLLRQSFSDWIIYNLRSGKRLTLFDDVYFTPILADSVALVAHELLDRGVFGIFNVVGDERLSKYEFAERVVKLFDLPRELITRGRMAESNLIARRPRDMSLCNAKAQRVLGRRLGSVDDHLTALHSQEAVRREELFHAVSDEAS